MCFYGTVKSLHGNSPQNRGEFLMGMVAANQHEEILATFTYKTFESENRSFCVFRFKNYDTQKEFTAVGSMLPDSKNVPVKLTGDWEVNRKSGHKQVKQRLLLFSLLCTAESEKQKPRQSGSILETVHGRSWRTIRNVCWRCL